MRDRRTGNPVGRPPIGPTIQIRYDPEQLAMLDEYAHKHGLSRAEALRQLTTQALLYARLEDEMEES